MPNVEGFVLIPISFSAMTKTLSASRLRKLLAAAPKQQLIDEIVELFTKFEVVENHFALRLKPGDDAQILASYKTRLSKAMLPKSDFGEPRVSEARRIVNEYRKVSVSPSSLADLMLFYVECGVKFLNDLGDYKESFYDSLERMFEAALKLISENELTLEFERRCRRVTADTSDMGYGFGDAMQYLFDEYIKQHGAPDES